MGDGVNWYAYVGSNPVVGVDPTGLIAPPWSPESTAHHMFTGDAWSVAPQGLAAFADGFIPFADPFRGNYNPCDPWLQGSRTMGWVTRDAMIAAWAAPTRVVVNRNVGGIEASWGSNFRVGWHRFPTKARPRFRVPWARGRSLPHYHRRGPGGMGSHRPWQGGW